MRNRDLRPAAKANPTIQQAFERFQKYNRLKNLSQGSLDFYAAKGRSFFRFLGDTEQPIHTITEETVEDYIFYMKDQQLHDTTINTNLRMVRAFLYWCMEKGYLEKYPIRLVRADDPIKEPYTTDELQKLLKEPDCKTCSFAEYRNWVIVNFLLGTGCRASTLLNLQIGDLDLSAGTVFFRHMKARNQQIVPLSKALVKIMEEYLEHRTSDPTAPLFVSEYGNQMTLNSLGNAIWNYNHSRGVEKTSLRNLVKNSSQIEMHASHDSWVLLACLACGGNVFFDKKPHVLFRRYNTNTSIDGGKLKSRLKYEFRYFEKYKNNRLDTACELLNCYNSNMSVSSKSFLEKVKNYKSSIRNRIAFLFYKDINCGIIASDVITRIIILFGCY